MTADIDPVRSPSCTNFSRRHFLRKAGLAVSALSVTGLLAACSPASAPAPSGKQDAAPAGAPKAPAAAGPVKFRMGWQPTMNGARYFVADASKYFQEAGLDLELVKFTAGPPFFSAFQSESIDVGFMAFPPASIAIAQGIPVKIIALENMAPHSEALVARPNSGIDKLEDIKGKSIGTVRGSSADYALRSGLKKANLTEGDIKVVPVDVTNLMPAFERGDIDAGWYWQPWQGQMRKAGGKQIITDAEAGVKMGIVWLAREKWAKDNPEALDRLFKALDMATKPIADKSDQAVKALAEGVAVEEDLAREVITREAIWPTLEEQIKVDYSESVEPATVASGGGLVGAFLPLAEFQQEVRAIETAPDYKAAFYTQPLVDYVAKK